MNSRMLKAALRYARYGWHVLPVHSLRNGLCSCGNEDCQSPGKHPRTKHGVKDATAKHSTIREWWAKWPSANVGIATGKHSRLVVLDIDPRHDGASSFTKLTSTEGSCPGFPAVSTGGGGRHIFFEYPSVAVKSRAGIVKGIDVRADGGYVVAPPSRHVSGKRYRWVDSERHPIRHPATLPIWLLQLMASAPPQEVSGDHGKIPSGQRNALLTSLAGAMRRRGASEETLVAALLEENQQRCDTPLPDNEVRKIAASVSKYPPAEETQDQKRKDSFMRALLPEGAKLFHNREKDAFAAFKVGDHSETHNMRDVGFRRYVAARYYKKFKEPISAQRLRDTVATFEGLALYEGQEHEVYTRLAPRRDAIYLDLCNDAWQVVKITPAGWQVLSESPVYFRRSRGMRGLPIPKRGGSVTDLRPFLNVSGDSDFVVLTSWLIAALRPKGPYPVLVLQGEAGSAKSTTVRVLRELVDPSTTPLRSEPRSTRDLMIAARNAWCIAFDNVSHLTPKLSDDLCRLATGGGFATRQLFTDTDEVLFDATRPVILNGIDAVVYRGDLLDRSLLAYLPVISDDHRLTEKKFWRDFKKAKSRILGALLDALTHALQRLDSVKLPVLPRMADFAQWAVAAEPSMGWGIGSFLRVYDSNRGTAVALGLEASLVANPLKDFLIGRTLWRGPAADLLRKITKYAAFEIQQQRNWPANAQLLSIQLRRIAPQLRAIGIDVQFGEKTAGIGSRRIITIRKRSSEFVDRSLSEGESSSGTSHVIRRYPRLESDASDAESSLERRARRTRRIRGAS